MRKYDDIINLPHHQSKTRPHMSIYDRAAQFSPFAALTGYDDAVKETAKVTCQRKELSEEEKAGLSAKLAMLQAKIREQPKVSITYFVPDEKKSGGAYFTETGVIKRIDAFERIVIMQNRKEIPIEDIVDISDEAAL